MALQEDLSIIAFFVSLTALLISLIMLTQATFGTAEGYRNCHPRVIGPWAQARHRKLHFPSFRLETVFETPEFTLIESQKVEEDPKSGAYLINGEYESRVITYLLDRGEPDRKPNPEWEPTVEKQLDPVPKEPISKILESSLRRLLSHFWLERSQRPYMAVGWLTFLEQLHEHETKYRNLTPRRGTHYQGMRPAVRRVHQSWDFMPTDAVRPLASVQFNHLLILCYRLRVTWYNLQLGQTSIRAEGSGHSFTPVDMRGMSFVFQYRFVKGNAATDKNHPANGHFVPSPEADMLAFGRIPACKELDIGYEWFDLGGEDYYACVIAMHEKIGVGSAILEDFRKSSRDRWNPEHDRFWHMSNDSLSLLAPFIPVESLWAVKIACPFRHRAGSMFSFKEGRLVLLERLQSTNRDTWSEGSGDVAAAFQKLATDKDTRQDFNHADGFGHTLFNKNAESKEAQTCLDMLRQNFNKTTTYFQKFTKTLPAGSYLDLVASHLEIAFAAHKESRDKPERDRRKKEGMSSWMTECAHLYADYIPVVYDKMRKRIEDKRKSAGEKEDPLPTLQDISEAWWMLIMRAFLWNLSTHQIRSPEMPMRSNLYDDTTLVWIT